MTHQNLARPGGRGRPEVGAALKAIDKLERPKSYSGREGASTWLRDRAVLKGLAKHLPNIFMRQDKLAAEIEMPHRTVKVALRRLEEAGLITKKFRPNKVSDYQLTFLTARTGVSQQGASGNASSAQPVGQNPPSGKAGSAHEQSSLTENSKSPLRGTADRAPAAVRTPLRKTPSKRPWLTRYKPNQYDGPCVICGKWVDVGEGTIHGSKPSKLYHRGYCSLGEMPPAVDPYAAYRKLEPQRKIVIDRETMSRR